MELQELIKQINAKAQVSPDEVERHVLQAEAQAARVIEQVVREHNGQATVDINTHSVHFHRDPDNHEACVQDMNRRLAPIYRELKNILTLLDMPEVNPQ